MKKLLFALCLVPSIASASLPCGCFSTDSDPTRCYIGVERPYYYSTDAMNNLCYGSAISALQRDMVDCSAHANFLKSSLDSCQSDFYSIVGSRDQYYANYNTCVGKYNSLVGGYNKNLALIKKLRAACGSKCKRIK